MLLLLALVIFSLFLPFVFLAARTSREEQRTRARFAILQAGGAGGLSSSKQTDLLKDADDPSTGIGSELIARLSARLRLDLLLLQANSRRTPRGLLRLSAMLALGTMLLGLLVLRPAWIAVLPGAAACCAPYVLLRWRARQRTESMNKALPQVLDMIARALRAGHSLPAALGIVAEEAAEPARSAFGEVFQKHKFGLPMRDALMELVSGFPSNDLKVLVTAILVQRDTGGNLVLVLDRTSTLIRERLKLEGEVRVHTAQGRMTGWILCLLPVLMLGMLMVTNPSYPRVLVDDPLGRKLLCGGVLLLGCGVLIIQRIVKIEV